MSDSEQRQKARKHIVVVSYVPRELKTRATVAARMERRSMSSFIAEALIDRVAKTLGASPGRFSESDISEKGICNE